MSILRRYGNGIPGEGKGVYRRRVYVPVRISLGRRRISCGLSHFVECYHSGAGYMLPFAVNVGVSPRFAVFCFMGTSKNTPFAIWSDLSSQLFLA